MYVYNQSYFNYSAGVLGILALAVLFTALLMVLVLPKEKDGRLPSVFQLLYDLFTPKVLVIEKLLQVLYVFLTCLAVLYGIVVFFNGFFTGIGNLVLGLVVLAVGPLVLRVLYELVLLLVMHVKTVREIQRKLDGGLWTAPPAAPQAPAPGTKSAPAANQPMVRCAACGTWYRQGQARCPLCGAPAPQEGDEASD